MDQQLENLELLPEAEEAAEYEKNYHLPFAEDLYEQPVQVEEKPQKVRKHRKKREKSGISVFGAIALVLVIALLSSLATAVILDTRWQKRMDAMNLAMQDKNAAIQAQIGAMDVGTGTEVSLSAGNLLTPGQVYQNNADAVVWIYTYTKDGARKSRGSGFLLSADGYVVSNYHVIGGADRIEVYTTDGAAHEATLVGFEETNEISVLKIEGENLPHVKLGSSNKMQIGDQVVAIGHPLGSATPTLTVGYVSAKDRMVATDGTIINMLQTDAAINSGNSGGPLFNMKGEVVGITTAKFSGLSASGVAIEGVSFAVPIDDVADLIADLQNLGYISSAYLGVMVLDVDPAAQAYGLPAGAYVDEVTPGFAAEAAGMKAQDIIIQLGGYEISSVDELTRMLRKFDPGQTVSVTVYRAGQEVQLQVTLDEKPREEAQTQPQDPVRNYPMPGDEGFEEWYRDFMEKYLG